MTRENQDVVGDKCVKDDSGNLSLDDNAKKVAWKQHYERLRNPDDLSDVDPVEGPPIRITAEMVLEATTKMSNGKAASPSGIVAEMLKAAGATGAALLAELANALINDNAIPSDWEDSYWREETIEV